MLLLPTPFRNSNFLRGKISLLFPISKSHQYCFQTVGFPNKFEGFLFSSSPTRLSQCIYVASPSFSTRMWPFFAVLGNSRASFKSAVTKSYTNSKPDTQDEVVNHIVSIVENTDLSNSTLLPYIERLCTFGSVSNISYLIQLLRGKSIFLDSNAYNILLASTSERREVELSLEIFKDLLVSSKGMSSESYLNLAKSFVDTNDCSLLLRFVREVAQLTSHCGTLVLNRLIYAFGEFRQIDKALIIFDHMKVLEYKPDLVTYNTVIGLLGRAGLVDHMLQEFAFMKKVNVMPDIVTYNTILFSGKKMGRLDLCLVYVKEMEENGLTPDLRTYTALIESFGRSGNIEEAIRLFKAMKSKKVHPSIYIYRSLINNLKKMGKIKDAASLSDEMNSCLPYLVGPKEFNRKNK